MASGGGEVKRCCRVEMAWDIAAVGILGAEM